MKKFLGLGAVLFLFAAGSAWCQNRQIEEYDRIDRNMNYTISFGRDSSARFHSYLDNSEAIAKRTEMNKRYLALTKQLTDQGQHIWSRLSQGLEFDITKSMMDDYDKILQQIVDLEKEFASFRDGEAKKN